MEPTTIRINNGMDEIIVTPTPGNETVLDLFVSYDDAEVEVSLTNAERRQLIRALGGIERGTWPPGREDG